MKEHTSVATPPDNQCPRCRASLDRAVAWASLAKATHPFFGRVHWKILCDACVAELEAWLKVAKDQTLPRPHELQEGTHYYWEQGRMVFTAYYHLLRGACCQSGCRHCPYGFSQRVH